MIPCGVPWPVCPYDPGEGLVSSGGRSRCPCCNFEWPDAERAPCPDPAAIILSDDVGEKGRVCESHAVHPSFDALRKAPLPVSWDVAANDPPDGEG
jgi:hypothetical protein